MATLKAASGSLLGTIVATTNAVSNVIGAAASSADLLTSYVAKHKDEQRSRYLIDKAEFNSKLIEEASVEKVKRELILKDFASNSDFHAERLSENMTYFSKLLEAK